ncbi:Proline-rich receptor-like protein kinase PERK12 [Raphanus sativus]|uniref:non-specific serine/threonine protein kinase n=1 Tax=Raphanus sativus TaxID=3726 RepID=A0A9W3CYF4_RAPSA|nr:proline-rich receptor-like protein kinase PERK12 [Raphanus sativus]KAJ4867499.1 Proline-rich receptor-like protein kinase PERK12 [Raphanus sativus]
MSNSGGSPTSSPPAPPADSAPPPADSSPPPPSNPEPSPPPPPDSLLPPLPSLLPPLTPTPPPASNSPPADSTNSPPPPTSTNTPPPPPPANSDTPPAPPNESNNPPPSPDAQSPPPPPSESPPPATPSEPTNSPPAPPSDPTNSPPIPPSPPAFSPPPSSLLPPPKPHGGPLVPPSVPTKETPPTNNTDGNSYQGKTIAGMAVAGVAILVLIAIVFVVRRKKKRNIDAYAHSHYLPHPNFSVKSDGFLYGQDPSKIHSGPSGSMYNSQQQQYSSMGNSYGSQRGHQSNDSAILGTGQTHFSYEELAEITQGFARHNILGEGGFGCVYKGTLHDGKVVAVKQLKAGSGQGDREFKAEVEIISRVHHRHLVSLVGYCISDQHRLLIYEYVSNQTLEHHLHGRGRPVLEWSKRVRIAIGSAKGLAYLHEDCHPKIIHRDIKSANILLDDEYEAQVADFGLARLNDTTQTHVSTRVMGTFGYLAPEYASSGKLTDRSDVFSFGVVLLELVTGRKPVDQNQPLGEESLVEWARPLLLKAIETGDCSELIDRRLDKHYVEHEVFRMIETAAACVRHSGPKRPRMVQVVRALDCDEDSGDISNGTKVGQSTTYNSGQYNQDITKFRKMAFGSGDSADTGMYSGDHSVISSSDFSGNESETRPFNNRRF